MFLISPPPSPPGRHQSAFQQMPMLSHDTLCIPASRYSDSTSSVLQYMINLLLLGNYIMSSNTCHQNWPCYLSNAAQHISFCRYVILLCTILCYILLFWYVLHRSQFIKLQVINVRATQDVTVATVDFFFGGLFYDGVSILNT